MVLRIIHSLFFYLLTGLSFVIGTTLTLLLVPFSRSKTGAFQTAAHLWARFLALFSGVRVKVSGLENVPRDRPVIFAANHQGMSDILIALGFLPVRFRFAIKKELFKVPLFGCYLRKAGYFSIDRKMVLSAYRTVDKIIEIIKEGESVLLFPEGTRTKTGEVGRLKRGSLLAALKSRAPIVPVAISGSYNILPRGSWIIRPHPVRVGLGKPIYIRTEADYESKVEEVRGAIADMLRDKA
jgi:1-acyl-sn-glycerol-3-phosphate acyltransferase